MVSRFILAPLTAPGSGLCHVCCMNENSSQCIHSSGKFWHCQGSQASGYFSVHQSIHQSINPSIDQSTDLHWAIYGNIQGLSRRKSGFGVRRFCSQFWLCYQPTGWLSEPVWSWVVWRDWILALHSLFSSAVLEARWFRTKGRGAPVQ